MVSAWVWPGFGLRFPFQDEHYDDEDADEVLRSSFSGRAVEVFDLPENEDMFLPSNMDSSQLGFKFKEVWSRPKLYTRGFGTETCIMIIDDK